MKNAFEFQGFPDNFSDFKKTLAKQKKESLFGSNLFYFLRFE